MSKIFKPKIVMPPVPPAPEPVRYEPPAKEEIKDADPNEKINEEATEEIVKKKNTKRPKTILTSPQGLTSEADTFNTTLMS